MNINSIYLENYSLIRNEYFSLFLFIVFAIVLTTLIMVSSYFLARQNPDVEKLSAYECGFEPYEDARCAFDVKFCVTAILFIIFDIEIMFLAPWCVSLSNLDLLGFWSMIDFLLELSVGFLYIWYSKALDW